MRSTIQSLAALSLPLQSVFHSYTIEVASKWKLSSMNETVSLKGLLTFEGFVTNLTNGGFKLKKFFQNSKLFLLDHVKKNSSIVPHYE